MRALVSRAIQYAYRELLPGFEAASGVAVDTVWSSTGAIVEQIASDAPFDLVIAGAATIDRFIADGAVLAGSRVDQMSSGIGVAVKAGAPRPDIGSGEAVKHALLAAQSIGYSQGPSGVYLLALFEKMGIAKQIRAKATQSTPGIPVAHYLAAGTVALGFQQVSELIDKTGIALVGPLPADIQKITMFASGVPNRSTAPDAARALQTYLSSPASDAAIRKHGMEPGRRRLPPFER
ncbi:MAG: substrate-binding domain-containing protein [Rhodospirillales bacterium]